MAETKIALVEKPQNIEHNWPRRALAAMLRAPEKADSTSTVGQLVFHPECSRCSWRSEAYTRVESEALAEEHRDATGHRPIPIYCDTLRNFMMNVT